MRVCVALFLLISAACLGTAEAADVVKTRAAAHENFGRIAFDWPAPVAYKASLDGATLVVRFERPLTTRLDQITRYLGAYIASASLDAAGTTLTAALTRPVSLKTFTEGNTIAIDLVDAASPAARKPSPSAAKPSVADTEKPPAAVVEKPPVVADQAPAAVAEKPPVVAAAMPSTAAEKPPAAVAEPLPVVAEPPPVAAAPTPATAAAAKPPAAAAPSPSAARPLVLVPRRPTVAAVSATAPAAADKPDVVVRFGEHEGYRRLVFDWKEPVDYSVSEEGSTARIHFTHPAVLDAARIGAALPGVTPDVSAEDGGTTLTLHLPEGIALRHFRSGGSIVLDLLQPGGRDAATKPDATIKPVSPGKKAHVPAVVPPPELIEPSAGVSMPLPPSAKGLPPPALPAAGPSSSLTAPAPGPALSVHYAATDDTGSLRFPWDRAVPAAVFRRAGALWVVFGAPSSADLSEVQLRGKAAVERIEQVPQPLATVLRLTTLRGLEPSLHRVDNEWVLDLKAQELHPELPITVSVQPGAKPPRVIFEMHEPGTAIAVTDPEVGDRLLVVPTMEIGRGLPAEASVVDFRAFVTAQGLVIRPNVDGVIVRPVATGVEVTGPDGLVLSDNQDRRLGGDGAAARLFDFDAWAGPARQTFLDRRSELERVAAAAPTAQRSHPRLALAEFYFANGYAAETLGVLAAIERDDPTFATDKLVRAMKGASALLDGDRETAGQELLRPMLDSEPEAALWRGALSAEKGDWAAAARGYDASAVLLTTYPKVLRNRLALLGAEAMIRSGQPDAAGSFLRLVTKDDPSPGDLAAAKFLTGLQAQADGDLDRAQQIWQDVGRTGDRPSRARALKERTMALLKAGKITRTDAIRQLDDLRFAWRGGDFEFNLLHDLGKLLVADGDYRRGLDVLRQAAGNYPDNPGTPQVQREIADAFSNIFLGANSDNLSPLKSAALYGEFKDLAASSTQRDAIVRRLVDRMIAVDLLDQADTLLSDQVTNRLTGVPKARGAAELAVIRLIDHRPEAAIKALDLPVDGQVPPELVRQRQQLRARALTDLGRADQAITALAGDSSVDADRLRADAYWKAKSWPDVARTLQRLAPAPGADGKLDKQDARLVLNLVAALALSSDQVGLGQVRDKYGAAMAQSPYADAFRVIASPDNAGASSDPRQQAQKLAEIGELKSFAAELRKTLDATKAPVTN